MSAGRVWLFDLDNTLHDATPHIFPHINRSMREYIERHLGVDEATATRLRQDYWQRYGATLHGLVRHHGIDPDHFLRETHHFPDLPRMVRFNKAVRHQLRQLPGRKILFSNGPRHYAQAILAITGLTHCFDALYALEDIGYHPKPMVQGFRRLLHAERLAPTRCILVEDTLANLETAHRLGMKTVWLSRETRCPPCVDIRIVSLHELRQRCGQR